MHDMARKLQRNKENGASLAIGASKDSLYTIQDGGAPSHRIAASSGQVGRQALQWGGWLLWFGAGGGSAHSHLIASSASAVAGRAQHRSRR